MRVVVGRIGRAHGIRGDLSVEPRTDEPEKRFAPGSSVLCVIGGVDRTLTVAAAKPHGDRLLVTFAGIADRTEAERFHGALLEVDVDPAEVPDEDDAFYDHQLIGLTVTVEGDDTERGTVRDVLHLPAHDSLVLDLGERTAQVPFVAALVPEVDLAAGTLTVADRPGLLDPDSADEAR